MLFQHSKASSKGYHSGATRPRPAERQDGCHHGAQDSVITSAFGSRRPPLVRITCTRCSPSKWPIVGALPAHYFGERPRASINRGSHHRVGEIQKSGRALMEREREREREATELTLAVHRTSSRTPLARLFFPCTVHRQPLRQSTTPHTRVGYYTTTVARTSINLVSLVLFVVSRLDHARRLDVDR